MKTHCRKLSSPGQMVSYWLLSSEANCLWSTLQHVAWITNVIQAVVYPSLLQLFTQLPLVKSHAC